MSKKLSVKKHSPLIVAALAVGVSGAAVAADENPFRMNDLPGGYQLAHQDEEKSSHEKQESNSSSEKMEHMDEHDGDHEKDAAEGKCGAQHMKSNEGKCGGAK